MELLDYIWPWLAVWIAWIWVAIWQWILIKRALQVMWKSPSMSTFYLTVAILWFALLESAVIYWLVVAFQLLSAEALPLLSSIWAGLAIWLTWAGAWIWEWLLVSWALSAIDRNPRLKAKIMTFMVLFVALIEVSAIYWLIVAFRIMWDVDLSVTHLWAGLAIWFAWAWVAIWRWYLSQKALEVMSITPNMMNYFLIVSILWIALVEAAAIYWLVVSFQLLGATDLWFYAATGAWLAIWLAGAWAGWWKWQLVVWALSSINRNPEIKNKIMTFMVLFVALVEVTAIYWLIIAFRIMWDWAGGADTALFVWAGLAIWLAWFWVGLWRWYMSDKALEVMWKNPKLISFFLTASILAVALIESAAIYALVVSFQILWAESLAVHLWLWAGLAIWLTGLWVWIWQWVMIRWAFDWMNSFSDLKTKLMAFMVLFVALIEVIAIYWLIVAFRLLAM